VAARGTKPKNAEKLLDYAVRQLGGRGHSLGELRQKLLRHCERREDVDVVLAKLKEAGYVDDRKYAENFAAARLANDGLGKMRVLRDLRERRVAPALAAEVVDRTFEGSDEAALIDQFLERKFRGKNLGVFLAEQKNAAAAYRRLRYAGFSAGPSIRALKRYVSEAEQFEDLETGAEEP
jgi:regulatory protein